MRLKVLRFSFFILTVFVIILITFYFFRGKSANEKGSSGTSSRFIVENNEIWEIISDKKIQLTDDGFEKSDIKISSDREKIGYYKHLYSKPLYQNKDYFENYLALMIYDLKTKKEKEIFKGDYHLGEWEWISPKEVIIYQGCGTECVAFWRVNIETDEKNSANYGVDYQWSADKKYVLAYRYTHLGITIGDKFGSEIFTLEREKNKIFPKLAEKTEGVWSPDSKKLALIIKKENQEKLEFLVFDVVEKKFKVIYQEDLESFEIKNFHWQNNWTIGYQINDKLKKINF